MGCATFTRPVSYAAHRKMIPFIFSMPKFISSLGVHHFTQYVKHDKYPEPRFATSCALCGHSAIVYSKFNWNFDRKKKNAAGNSICLRNFSINMTNSLCLNVRRCLCHSFRWDLPNRLVVFFFCSSTETRIILVSCKKKTEKSSYIDLKNKKCLEIVMLSYKSEMIDKISVLKPTRVQL